MYLLNWYCVIVCQFLLLNVDSLVLFTANVEDIKKIAQKFVSDSLAQKIADLIISATNGKRDVDVSEENNENDKVNDISKNDWSLKADSREDGPRIDKRKLKNKPRSTQEPKEANSEFSKKTRFDLEYSRNSDDDRPMKKRYHKSKENAKRYKNVKKKELFRAKSLQPKEGSKFIFLNSEDESKYIKDFNKIKKLKNRIIDDSKKIMLRANTLSTKKEKNEFDQYDNLNYPRAGVVATSGAVTLTIKPKLRTFYDDNRY